MTIKSPTPPTLSSHFDAQRYIRGVQRRAAAGRACPDCGGPLVHGEGCALCPVCGYSNCGGVNIQ